MAPQPVRGGQVDLVRISAVDNWEVMRQSRGTDILCLSNTVKFSITSSRSSLAVL